MRKFTDRIENANYGSYTSKLLCNQSGLNRVLQYMFDPSFWEQIKQSVENFDNNAIVSLYVVPSSLYPIMSKRYHDELNATVYLMSYIQVLDNQIPLSPAGGYSTGENVIYLDPRVFNKAFYGGSAFIEPKFGSSGLLAPSYLDYSPYTKVQVNIPFIGLVDVETNLIMNRWMDLWYTLDLETMSMTAYLYSRSRNYRLTVDEFNIDTDDNFLVAKNSCSFGSQIALNGENRGQMMQATLSSFGNVVSDVATMGMTGGLSAMRLGNDINSTLHPAKSFNSGVSGQGYNNFFDSPIVQVYITRPIFDGDSTFYNAQLNGYVADKSIDTGGLKAFIDEYSMITGDNIEYYKIDSKFEWGVDNIQPDTVYQYTDIVGATQDEINELNALLSSGIYYRKTNTEG